MTRSELYQQIQQKNSYLCIGLDTDLAKIPSHLLKEADPVFEFNRQIIEATHDLCVAYKPNLAFYESLGPKGLLSSLEKTLGVIPKNIFTIADAKRGDIGNTSGLYAKAFFENYSFDSVTVAPYMGKDSVTPFLQYKDKWVVLLALTSNPGASDFQLSELAGKSSGMKLFEQVLEISREWGSNDNMMYVVGATRPEMIGQVRRYVPGHFLLVPGVGAQGGDLKAITEEGINNECGLLVNASRQVLYASSGTDFAKAARAEALKLQQQMAALLQKLL